MSLTVIKASGEKEEFDLRKLVESLIRSGAPEYIAEEIAGRVESSIAPSSRTKHIYKLAKRLLKQYSYSYGMKYALKKAIAELGPSGYPFEKYFSRVLEAYGYTVETNRTIEGFCVRHEVDVLAVKGLEHTVIECKYHNDGGKATDVKTALYVHSRVEDIKKAYSKNNNGFRVREGWLVTNTRCTSDAIKYAECVGLKIVSWRYPDEGSLERLVEGKRLYPVTVLPSAKRKLLDSLFANNIVMAQEIADMEEGEFIKKSGLDRESAIVIKKEADRLCPCG